MARTKKEGAVKAGDLQDGLMRFSFIADKNQIDYLTRATKERNISMKSLMAEIISNYIKKSPNYDTKVLNEQKLLAFLRNRG